MTLPVKLESIDKMCGEDNRREYSIPDIYNKMIHIRYKKLIKSFFSIKVIF